MEQLKITLFLLGAVILQWTAGNVWESLVHIDFVLIAIVYAALQKNAIKAVVFGSIGGIAIDALSGGLLGSNGFSKTLIAYIVSEISRRFNMDNFFLRIPVLAVACVLDDLIYVALNNLLGDPSPMRFWPTLLTNFIATVTIGLILFAIVDFVSSRFGSKSETFRSSKRGKKHIELR